MQHRKLKKLADPAKSKSRLEWEPRVNDAMKPLSVASRAMFAIATSVS